MNCMAWLEWRDKNKGGKFVKIQENSLRGGFLCHASKGWEKVAKFAKFYGFFKYFWAVDLLKSENSQI